MDNIMDKTHQEILDYLLFDERLTNEEYLILNQLVEEKLNQVLEVIPKTEKDTREEEQLELLKYKITKWRKK
jgi:hypothetical protein|tara:strand:- start:154 stop:369 length:216 start_codon:yes stop_codon:yes gene_type:complete